MATETDPEPVKEIVAAPLADTEDVACQYSEQQVNAVVPSALTDKVSLRVSFEEPMDADEGKPKKAMKKTPKRSTKAKKKGTKATKASKQETTVLSDNEWEQEEVVRSVSPKPKQTRSRKVLKIVRKEDEKVEAAAASSIEEPAIQAPPQQPSASMAAKRSRRNRHKNF